jgi:hypothetical protein
MRTAAIYNARFLVRIRNNIFASGTQYLTDFPFSQGVFDQLLS